MNITYLIGNGFDLNIGLKCRYSDFYEYYIGQHPKDEAEVVKRFKSGINDYINQETNKTVKDPIDWRDLEIALGQFTETMTEKEGEQLYLDINDNLKQYLIEEFKYLDPDVFSKDVFYNHLANPVSDHFNRGTFNSIKSFLSRFSGTDDINIINFNYTNTIEVLSGFNGKALPLGLSISGRQARLNGVYHIHQTLNDDEIILGLNDISQIANKQFKENNFLSNLYVKPRTNALLGTGVNEDCEQIISKTDLFVIFGTSAGISDQKWWKAICEKLVASEARLIYFVHSTETIRHQNLYLMQLRDRVINQLLVNAGKDVDAVFEKIIPRCFVSFSKTMFKLTVNYGERIKPEKTYKIRGAEVTMNVLDMDMRYIVVSVDAPNEESGVLAEGMWLKDCFPGYTHDYQQLLQSNNKGMTIPFDLIPISTQTRRKDIYFEISSFLGKSNIYPLQPVSLQQKKEAITNILSRQ